MAYDAPIRTPRGLSEFPVEVLNTKIPSHEIGKCHKKNREALVALSGMCRTFRDLAQPLLYHFLPYLPDALRFPKLVRTLEERPDLAMQVKRICRERYSSCGWDIFEQEEIELIKSVARRLSMEREGDSDFESAEDVDISAGEFCLEVLVAMLPSLESLEITLEQSETRSEDPHFIYLQERYDSLGSVAASAHLKHLMFDGDWGFGADNPAITTLLNISPNLEHIQLLGCVGTSGRRVFQDSAERPLRVVEMDQCFLQEDPASNTFLSDMIAHAPNLQRFRYSLGLSWVHEDVNRLLSVPGFLACLQPVQSSLTSLDIDLTALSYEALPRHVLKKGSLRALSKLETLHLDDTSICIHRHEKEGAPSCLVDNIPPNLHTLNLRVYQDTSIWGDLEKLSMEVQRFPNLKELVINVIPQGYKRAELEKVRSVAYSHGRKLAAALLGSSVAFTLFANWEPFSLPVGPIHSDELLNQEHSK
ncbi:unnamed protein product [Clonostachys solani]|uniref:Uncharacterized protein n=1 Tax=Clonostachys solani TaxID=160281 RepID=A0A9N9ZJV3_9HYPO|nr:unnamed protein product [Clonostachys solani]